MLPSNQSRRYFTILTAFAGAVAMSTFTAHTQSRTQARSMVVSRGGIVATESPLASQAGAMILAVGRVAEATLVRGLFP